jgi:hypothetical protein
VLRRSGTDEKEVTKDWRRLHNEELHILYSSPNNVRVIKSRRMKWTGYVAGMGEARNAYKTSVRKPEELNLLGDMGISGWMVLKFKTWSTVV